MSEHEDRQREHRAMNEAHKRLLESQRPPAMSLVMGRTSTIELFGIPAAPTDQPVDPVTPPPEPTERPRVRVILD